MADFLSVVNDLLVLEGIIAGDDDAITSFASNQHVSAIRLARKSVQQELASLVSDQLVPFEKTDAVLEVTQRSVSLSADFQRFQDEHPWLIETNAAGDSLGTYISEFPGGEERLRKVDINYRENGGKPHYWYWIGDGITGEGGVAKSIGFYLVPSSTYYYRYYYERDISLVDESSTIPFVTPTEIETFTQICARRFKYLKATPTLREQLFPLGLERDLVIAGSRNTLAQLSRHKPPTTQYGRNFV